MLTVEQKTTEEMGLIKEERDSLKLKLLEAEVERVALQEKVKELKTVHDEEAKSLRVEYPGILNKRPISDSCKYCMIFIGQRCTVINAKKR